MEKNREIVTVNKADLSSWAERLESLRKCMLEPEKCTHEGGCDYAAVDSCLDQIVSEIEQYLQEQSKLKNHVYPCEACGDKVYSPIICKGCYRKKHPWDTEI